MEEESNSEQQEIKQQNFFTPNQQLEEVKEVEMSADEAHEINMRREKVMNDIKSTTHRSSEIVKHSVAADNQYEAALMLKDFENLSQKVDEMKKGMLIMNSRFDEIRSISGVAVTNDGKENSQRPIEVNAIFDLIRTKVNEEVFTQVSDLKHQIEIQYAKNSEMHELRKLITALSQRILSDSQAYVQASLKDIITSQKQLQVDINELLGFRSDTLEYQQRTEKAFEKVRKELNELQVEMAGTKRFATKVALGDLNIIVENLKEDLQQTKLQSATIEHLEGLNQQTTKLMTSKENIIKNDLNAEIKEQNECMVKKIQEIEDKAEKLISENKSLRKQLIVFEAQFSLCAQKTEMAELYLKFDDYCEMKQHIDQVKKLEQQIKNVKMYAYDVKCDVEKNCETISRFDEILCEKASKLSLENFKHLFDKFIYSTQQDLKQLVSQLSEMQVPSPPGFDQKKNTIGNKYPVKSKALSNTTTVQYVTMQHMKQYVDAAIEQQILDEMSPKNNDPIHQKFESQAVFIDQMPQVQDLLSKKLSLSEYKEDLALQLEQLGIEQILKSISNLQHKSNNIIVLLNETVKLHINRADETMQVRQNRIHTLINQVCALLSTSLRSVAGSDSFGISKLNFSEKLEQVDDVHNMAKYTFRQPNDPQVSLFTQTHNAMPLSSRIKKHLNQRILKTGDSVEKPDSPSRARRSSIVVVDQMKNPVLSFKGLASCAMEESGMQSRSPRNLREKRIRILSETEQTPVASLNHRSSIVKK